LHGETLACSGMKVLNRAGALEQYGVSLPPDWKEVPVSNAKSGNYCQPRCDEATTEVAFGNPEQGTFQIIIIPTTKLLIAKKNPTLSDVGNSRSILDAISPAITGSSVAIEDEDIVRIEDSARDDRLFYEVSKRILFSEDIDLILTHHSTSL